MTDQRKEEAHKLLFQAEQLHLERRDVLLKAAELHVELARERLAEEDFDGWIDLYAAISSLSEAGRFRLAHELIEEGRIELSKIPVSDRSAIEQELKKHERYLQALSQMESLWD